MFTKRQKHKKRERYDLIILLTVYYLVFKIISGGNIQTYPFNSINPDGPLRNCINYERDLRKASKKKSKSYHGIKSKTILSDLSF
jgi:hypothetical protein